MKRKFGAVRNSFLKAYSLIELSIVLVIVSVLVSGAMVVSVDSLKTDQIRITKERIDAVYKRLAYHIKTNRDLPCPALTNKVRSADSDYGVAGTCAGVAYGVYASGNFIWGALPCATLGLPLDYCEDAFGSKFLYFVDKRFTVAADTGVAPVFDADINNYNFSTMANNQLSSSPATIWTIKENPAGSLQNITANAVFGIVSAGANKFGAYNSNSSTAISTAGSDSDELMNQNATSGSGYFVSSSPASNSFDDIVFYKTMKDIIADFTDVTTLVPCDNIDPNYINGGVTGDAWLDGVVYSKKNICASPYENVRWSKKCSSNGNFVTVSNSCITTVGTSCALTNGQDLGSGSEYTGVTQSYPDGSTILLSCKSNYGRKIIVGSSNVSDNSAQTCSRSPTDRAVTSDNFPFSICIAGVLRIYNDCSSCRNCYNNDSTSATVLNNTTVSQSMSCNSDSRSAADIITECRDNNVTYALAHGASANFGHAKRRKCNCPCEERNVCTAVQLQCLDGAFQFISDVGYDLGGTDNCASGRIQCGYHSQACGNGC